MSSSSGTPVLMSSSSSTSTPLNDTSCSMIHIISLSLSLSYEEEDTVHERPMRYMEVEFELAILRYRNLSDGYQI
ncbi:hypothetical protein LOK49_LG14G01421 [Camellia lanceoleosa]|uniref:Uncharacterized protein n=1 Tax=Camellia lanceoleosa TaxID=1840588 RepID=A0ACC0FDH3_9ERIC|nr:hypothetical protein LOK49_LG14G01421 [Camellia lanceoleosa]